MIVQCSFRVVHCSETTGSTRFHFSASEADPDLVTRSVGTIGMMMSKMALSTTIQQPTRGSVGGGDTEPPALVLSGIASSPQDEFVLETKLKIIEILHVSYVNDDVIFKCCRVCRVRSLHLLSSIEIGSRALADILIHSV